MAEVKFPFIMTLKEFREKTKDLDEDTILVAEIEEDFKFNEMDVHYIFPKTERYPAVIWLTGSQVVNAELNLEKRLDRYLNGG